MHKETEQDMPVDLHKKYDEKFTVPEHHRRLSTWEMIAKRQIIRWLDDDEFRDYCATEVLKNAENPPGPFTRFLYWFGYSCEAGWGVMIDVNDYSGQIFLCDHYYKWMHKLRDEILTARGAV